MADLMPDQVCQGGKAEIHTLTGKALGLPVQRLVLAILFEDKQGDQAWPGPSTRDHMGAGGWLIFSQARRVNFSRAVWITFH